MPDRRPSEEWTIDAAGQPRHLAPDGRLGIEVYRSHPAQVGDAIRVPAGHAPGVYIVESRERGFDSPRISTDVLYVRRVES